MNDNRKMPTPFYSGTTLNTLVTMPLSKRDIDRPLRDGERWLGRFILPAFQRPAVWSPEQQIRLIESIWMELPIGAFVYNQVFSENCECDQWLIDGQQRITALIAYTNDEFPVFGHYFSEITEVDRRAWDCKAFPCIELCMTDEAQLEDTYNRLAYGGTSHE